MELYYHEEAIFLTTAVQVSEDPRTSIVLMHRLPVTAYLSINFGLKNAIQEGYDEFAEVSTHADPRTEQQVAVHIEVCVSRHVDAYLKKCLKGQLRSYEDLDLEYTMIIVR